MKTLFILLWLISLSDGFGAFLAGRQCFRIRNSAKVLWVYEWFTAFGLGLFCYAIAALWGTFNSIVNGPHNDYSKRWILNSIGARVVLFVGMWTIALVMMNGERPGWVRSTLYWVLKKFGAMKFIERTASMNDNKVTDRVDENKKKPQEEPQEPKPGSRPESPSPQGDIPEPGKNPNQP